MNKSVSPSNFHFINPQKVHCFLKFLKNPSQFCGSSLLHSSKLLGLDDRNLTCFIQNLNQNLMNLLLGSKYGKIVIEQSEKVVKTETVQKTIIMWHSIPKGKHSCEKSVNSLKRQFFCQFSIIYHFPIESIYKKMFLQVTLIS